MSSIEGELFAGKEVEVNGQQKDAHEDDFSSKQLLPQIHALTYEDPYLSPEKVQNFDVDAFLVSRASGATLSQISNDLHLFKSRIRTELDRVVDQDFRSFVDLGVASKAQVPRISRLDWKQPQRWDADSNFISAPAGNLGLASVRDGIIDIRKGIETSEQAIQRNLEKRISLSAERYNLELLVNFNDSLRRLEDILQVEKENTEAPDSYKDSLQQSDFYRSFEQLEEEAAAAANFSNDASSSASKPIKPRRRTSIERITMNGEAIREQTIDLPSRIARASSECYAMAFLSRQVSEVGFKDFVENSRPRIDRMFDALRQDLRKLIIALVSPGSRISGNSTTTSLELLQWSRNGTESTSMQQLKEQLEWLEMAFTSWSLISQFSSSFDTSTTELYDLIRSSLVEPWCQKAITATILRGQNTALKGKQSEFLPSNVPSGPLKDLYNDILGFVEGISSTILRVASQIARKQPTDGASVFNFYVHSVWQEIGTRLMESIGDQLFFVGRLQEFRRNYLTTMAFLDQFEAFAPSIQQLQVLHGDVTFQNMRTKRWQLMAYFHMRAREIVTSFEETLKVSSVNESYNTQQLPFLRASKVTIQAFTAPWDENAHIEALSHRQWRLSLQVLSRFKKWIQDELPALDTSARKLPATTTDQHKASPYGTSINTPQRTGTPTQHDVDHDNAIMDMCTAVCADLYWLKEQIQIAMQQKITPLLNSDGNDAASITLALDQSLQTFYSIHEELIPAMSNKVTAILKLRCAEPLRLVRSVSMQYRSATATTGGSGAIEPSYFVNQFLRPVQMFIRGASSGNDAATTNTAGKTFSAQLPRSIREKWIGEVIEDFVERYTQSLRAMSKNFESLQRLKRNNAMSSNSLAGSTETGNVEATRMYSQMMADVEYLETEVKNLSITETTIATDSFAWTQLKKAARGE